MITSFLVIFFFLGDIFFFAEGNKKKYSPKQKKYSPTNEVTHPTETRICLWYIVFMPSPLLFFYLPSLSPHFLLPSYSLCYFIKWGDKHNFSALHDLLSSTKKHFLCALTSHIKGIYFYNCISFKYPPSWFFWLLTRGGGDLKSMFWKW